MTGEKPEILDEARRQPSRAAVEAPDLAIADDEAALVRRGLLDLMQVPRLLAAALGDIRTIAEGMATLPKLLIALDGIQNKVDSLDDEVKQMRAAVESMGGNVEGLGESIERLEPHLEDVSRVAHPLRRINPARRRRDDAGR
jgi:predicted nuclease with TOPRIM domain